MKPALISNYWESVCFLWFSNWFLFRSAFEWLVSFELTAEIAGAIMPIKMVKTFKFSIERRLFLNIIPIKRLLYCPWPIMRRKRCLGLGLRPSHLLWGSCLIGLGLYFYGQSLSRCLVVITQCQLVGEGKQKAAGPGDKGTGTKARPRARDSFSAA